MNIKQRLINYLDTFKSDNFLIVAVIIMISVILGFCSIFVLGEHNPVEKAAESLIERELHMPSGSVDLDPCDYEKKP
jgi:hypothetical protein